MLSTFSLHPNCKIIISWRRRQQQQCGYNNSRVFEYGFSQAFCVVVNVNTRSAFTRYRPAVRIRRSYRQDSQHDTNVPKVAN